MSRNNCLKSRLKLFFILTFILLVGIGPPSYAQRSHSRSSTTRTQRDKQTSQVSKTWEVSSKHGTHHSTSSTSVKRDSHGRIERSSAAKEKFMRQTGYPHGRPGYVIDHIIPLSVGGRDDPPNMQWQTKADAKAKDKWERGQKTSKSKVKHKRK